MSHTRRPDDLRRRLESALADKYTLGRELPRGGMSRVFAGTELALGRTIVIKVLAPELTATLSAERFKREIALAARLQHPHIVPLLSAGHVGDSLYYTMPLVDGESLRDRMSRERPMPIAAVLRILEEVASALQYAHAEHIVHRDIKPENVMFFHDSAVVLDFGIGKAVTAASPDPADPASARITQGGMSLGTPIYIPPEQAMGDPDLDHRADIYALGVLAYEMLCGHPPFAGRTPQIVLAAHINDTPQPIAQRRPDVPAPLAEIVMRCLAKRPNDRPQHAEEIASAARASRSTSPNGRAAAHRLARIPLWVPWATTALFAVVAIVLAVRLMQLQ